MQLQLRRYFAFNRLYYEVLRNLSTSEKKAIFAESVCLYGFEKKEPSFDNDLELCRAWGSVFPDLSYSWEQVKSGTNGGNVSGNVRTKKATVKTSATATKKEPPSQNNVFPISFPDPTEPTEQFKAYITSYGLEYLINAPIPICGPQLRWFIDCVGVTLTTSVMWYINNLIKDNGGNDYWKAPGMETKSVGELCRKAYEQSTDAFNRWMKQTFERLATLDEDKRLLFRQYMTLIRTYGRTNVIVKLDQLNRKKKIYKNITVYNAIDSFIKRSIAKKANSKYSLPSFDDDLNNLHVESCPSGYDKDFYLPFCYPLFKC